MFKELEVIELTHDIKEYALKAGDHGTIVEIYQNGKAYEVEFVASNGRAIALLTLMPDDIRVYVHKNAYVSFGLNAPISLETVSGMTTENAENIWRRLDINQIMIKTETPKSKANLEEFYYPMATI